MPRTLSLLCSIYFFVTAAMLFGLLAFLYPVVMLFDRRKKLPNYLTLLWGFHFVRLNPFWNCRFEGLNNLGGMDRCVIVANHQSLADIFVLSGLRHHFRWVAKDSLMRLPFFGWIMRINGDVSIKRGDMKSIKSMMSKCKQWLNRDVSILMFPEGTRSENGSIGEFRDGPFRLSVDCKVPVVPVVISGTRDVLPKHARIFNFVGDMTVRILPPVRPDEFEGNSGRMRKFIHQLMAENLSGMRNEVSA